MNTNRIQNIILRIVGKQSITVQDVTDLQHGVEEGGFITREEAEALFLVERMLPTACASWGVFFIETLTAHLVWERRPTGKVLADDLAWLSHTLALPRTGPARHIGPLLVSLLSEAVEADEQLVAMALAENADDANILPQRNGRCEIRSAA